jgi:tyrosyl-DNA phosphodiesterase 2
MRCLKASSHHFRDAAIVSDLRGESFSTYGVISVFNNDQLQPTSFTTTSFPSTMGRSLLATELIVNGRRLVIGTSHLESLNSAPVRQQQLTIAAKRFDGDVDCFYMGDFNLDSPEENENLKTLLSDFKDTWTVYDATEEGKTFDTLANPMIKHYGLERARYDRILYKSKHWRPTFIEMIGTEPFGQEEGRDLVPSDHFGLVADFRYSS